MDGIHDLGGMHGFGPVRVERDEPVFHARWEGRVFALTGATGGSFVPNVDKFRHAIERMDPVEYLSAGYYGRWLRAIETRLVEAGELEAGAVEARAREIATERDRAATTAPDHTPGGGTPGVTTALAPETPVPTPGAAKDAALPAAPASPAQVEANRPRSRYRRAVDRAPRFRAGDTVRARDFHPAGHTRLPRYVRGKRGRIATVYDAYVLPDTNAHDGGESPQYLYCIAFDGDELWGADAEPGTLVHLDLFETYFEPTADGRQ